MKTTVRKTLTRHDAIAEMESTLPKWRVDRATKNAEKEVLQIRLAELRKIMGFNQEDIESFSQSGVSKLEKRKDMKVSTLIEYLNCIGMGLEIIAYPRSTTKRNKKSEDGPVKEVVLLKS